MSNHPEFRVPSGRQEAWPASLWQEVLASESTRRSGGAGQSTATSMKVQMLPLGPAPEVAELKAMEARIARLEQLLTPSVIVVRPLTKSQAKKELLAYFRKHPGAYPSEAALALQLDPARSRDLCAELVREGKLEG